MLLGLMFQDGDQSSSHHIHIPEGQTEEGKQQKKQIEIEVAFKRSTTQVLQKIRTNRVERERNLLWLAHAIIETEKSHKLPL